MRQSTKTNTAMVKNHSGRHTESLVGNVAMYMWNKSREGLILPSIMSRVQSSGKLSMPTLSLHYKCIEIELVRRCETRWFSRPVHCLTTLYFFVNTKFVSIAASEIE